MPRITVLPYKLMNWRYSPVGVPAVLRIAANISFISDSGELVEGSGIGSNRVYVAVSCPVTVESNASGLAEPALGIPKLELTTTTDSKDYPLVASYSAGFFDSVTGELIKEWNQFTRFKVPPAIGTLNATTGLYEATWELIRRFNLRGDLI